MSVWTTKALDRERDYIVLKHTIRGVNNIINGVKFRDGFAVVEKGSKKYHELKKIPFLKKSLEFPLVQLRQLNFITRTADIRMVYGQDVYSSFIKAESKAKELAEQLEIKDKERQEIEEQAKREEELILKEKLEDIREEAIANNNTEKVEEISAQIPEITKCAIKTKTGSLCKFEAAKESPSNYCRMHILEDPVLDTLNLDKPEFMTKKDKKAYRNKAIEALARYKRNNGL